MSRLRTSHLALAVAVWLASCASGQAAHIGVDLNTFPSGIGGTTFQNTHGYSFSLSQTYTLTALGIFDVDADGLGEAHEVAIWTSGGTLLASTTVPSGTGGTFVASADGVNGWRFATIPDLALNPGDYVIGAHYSATNTDDDSFSHPAGNVTLLPGVTLGDGRDTAALTPSLTFPERVLPATNAGFFGPNFQVADTAAVVPEPSSLTLLAVGGVGALAGAAWRRRKRIPAA